MTVTVRITVETDDHADEFEERAEVKPNGYTNVETVRYAVQRVTNRARLAYGVKS